VRNFLGILFLRFSDLNEVSIFDPFRNLSFVIAEDCLSESLKKMQFTAMDVSAIPFFVAVEVDCDVPSSKNENCAEPSGLSLSGARQTQLEYARAKIGVDRAPVGKFSGFPEVCIRDFALFWRISRRPSFCKPTML